MARAITISLGRDVWYSKEKNKGGGKGEKVWEHGINPQHVAGRPVVGSLAIWDYR